MSIPCTTHGEMRAEDGSLIKPNAPVSFDGWSMSRSDAKQFADYFYNMRVQKGFSNIGVNQIFIKDDAFVVSQMRDVYEDERDTYEFNEEDLAKAQEFACKLSEEAFNGARVIYTWYGGDTRESALDSVAILAYLNSKHRLKTEILWDLSIEAFQAEAENINLKQMFSFDCGTGVAKSEPEYKGKVATMELESGEVVRRDLSEGGSTSDGDSTPKATSAPQVENYSGCKGLEDLIPKLAFPGTVTISYYQVVQIGRDNLCDDIIKEVNKPENLKD